MIFACFNCEYFSDFIRYKFFLDGISSLISDGLKWINVYDQLMRCACDDERNIFFKFR